MASGAYPQIESVRDNDSPELKKDIGSEKEVPKESKNKLNLERASNKSEGSIMAASKEGDLESKAIPIDDSSLQEVFSNQLAEEMDAKRNQEKAAFKKLIEENVKMKSEVDKMTIVTQEVNASRDALQLKLQLEEEASHEYGERIKDLETELWKLRHQQDIGVTEGATVESGNATAELQSRDGKIKDLQQKLKRLAKDYEKKSRQIQSLEHEVLNQNIYTKSLESLLDQSKVEEVRKEHQERLNNNHKAEADKRDNVLTGDGDTLKRSQVCTIL